MMNLELVRARHQDLHRRAGEARLARDVRAAARRKGPRLRELRTGIAWA